MSHSMRRSATFRPSDSDALRLCSLHTLVNHGFLSYLSIYIVQATQHIDQRYPTIENKFHGLVFHRHHRGPCERTSALQLLKVKPLGNIVVWGWLILSSLAVSFGRVLASMPFTDRNYRHQRGCYYSSRVAGFDISTLTPQMHRPKL